MNHEHGILPDKSACHRFHAHPGSGSRGHGSPRSGRAWLPLLFLSAMLSHAQTLDFSWFTVDGGGGSSAVGALTISGTVGQPDAGTMTTSTLKLEGGLWPGPALPAVASCIAPPLGLVAWWRAENNAFDSVGTNHGTLRNGTTFGPGKVGEALSFHGTNDFVQVGQNTLDGSTSLSVAAWVNFNSLHGSDQTIFSALKSGTEHYFTLMRLGDGQFQFIVSGGCELDVPYPFQTGQWYHVAAVKCVGVMTLYVNGAEIGSQSTFCAGPVGPNLGTTLIGGQDPIVGDTVQRPMDGLIDEVTVFNRALAPGEVAALYAAGSAGMCLRPTILAAAIEAGGVFRLEGLGMPGATQQVQAADSLPASVWQTVTNVTADANGSFVVTESVDGRRQRLYRAVSH